MKKIALLFTAILVFSSVSVYAQKGQANLDNGKKLFERGDYDGAIKELNEAIKRDSKLAEAYAYRSRAYNGKNDYDSALSDANRAIKLNSKLAMGYYARGNVYRNKEDYDRAIADYNEAIKLDPKFALAYSNRGNAYYNKGDYNRAIADSTEAIKLDPKNAGMYGIRGMSYNEKKDYDRAIADYTEAIKLDPNAIYYGVRGSAYYDKKDYERAIADMEIVLRFDPNNSDAKTVIADAKRKAAAEQSQKAEQQRRETANRYDPSKFTVVPSDFEPANYTSVDLFRAVSNLRNLEIVSNKKEAIYNQAMSEAFYGGFGALGLASTYMLQYVSELTFVRQDGVDITFTSDDKDITQTMTIDQRSGLQPGQKVRVYYMITKSPLTTWDVIAIEKR
jgi:tetratricopeptide (TPR) repeat protein